MRELRGVSGAVIMVLGVGISIFHIYTAAFGVYAPFIQRGIHLMVLLPMAFLLFPARKDAPKDRVPIWDWLLAALAVLPSLFVVLHTSRIEARIEFVDEVLAVELVLGTLVVILAIEAIRRAVTPVMSILVGIFILYSFLSPYLPGFFHHRGLPFDRHIETYYLLTGQSVYGVLVGISATYVALFVIFGAFILETGVGNFYTDFARSLAGGTKGGPAKIAVVSSACFGTVSGSAVANVYTTGSFTIPMMKRLGYKAEFAGAVEAVASTGGQLMPPVMGAAAFIMAQTLGMAYISVALKAAISAVMYFLAVGMMVHFRALKIGLVGEPKAQLPKLSEVLPRATSFLPVVVLFYLLIIGYSPLMGGFVSILLSVAISYLRKDTRMTPKKIADALAKGAKNTVMVAMALVGAQIIVAVVTHTGLALNFASLIVAASHGILFIALVLVATVAIILGIGVPTTAAYVITATIGASAIIRMGVDPYAAHLFTFYFAVISNVTPPVAVAAYAGAGLANSDPLKTGVEAFLLASAGYLVPFMFVYNPALVLVGEKAGIIYACITAIFGIIALSGGIQGWFWGKLGVVQRLLLVMAGFLLIWHGPVTDVSGIALTAVVFIWKKFYYTEKQL